MINGKNATAILTTVIASTISRHGPAGRDDIWIAKTSTDETVMCVMPGLKPASPPEVRTWMQNRAIANLTGRCPVCDAVMGADAEHRSSVRHEPWCVQTTPPKFVTRWFR